VRIRFGTIELDPECRQLWRGRRELHLSTKAFDLLTLLVEQCPNVVPKATIHQHLWPGTHVSATNLPGLIAEIRDTIGDDARRSRFVRTVHGVGYALSGPVTRMGGQSRAGDDARAWLVSDTCRVALSAGENVLGREGRGVILLESSTVSRRHARIVIDARGVTVEDLGSKNGTYVNDRSVTGPVRIGDGDRVRTGSLLFTFRLARLAGSTETQSSRAGQPPSPASSP
jgi:DNA-binding winged helix-turn-helix (wHTH) protein